MAGMYTLDELPVPDWGLTCPACGHPLAGSKTHRCEQCGEVFDVRRLLVRQRPVPELGLVCPECGCRDALYYLAEATRPSAPWTQEPWACACGETVPAGFEICWSCGASHPGFDEAPGKEEEHA